MVVSSQSSTCETDGNGLISALQSVASISNTQAASMQCTDVQGGTIIQSTFTLLVRRGIGQGSLSLF